MSQDIEWVRDAEEVEAWRVESERIFRKHDPLNSRLGQVLTKVVAIRDRGLARNPGKGFRPAILTSDESEEMERLLSEAKSLDQALDAVLEELKVHFARRPRPKARQVED